MLNTGESFCVTSALGSLGIAKYVNHRKKLFQQFGQIVRLIWHQQVL